MGYDKAVEKLLRIYGDNPIHVTPFVISKIYKNVFGTLPDGCISESTCQAHDVANMVAIVGALQDDILKIDLSHIDGTKLVHGDPVSGEYFIYIL